MIPLNTNIAPDVRLAINSFAVEIVSPTLPGLIGNFLTIPGQLSNSLTSGHTDLVHSQRWTYLYICCAVTVLFNCVTVTPLVILAVAAATVD